MGLLDRFEELAESVGDAVVDAVGTAADAVVDTVELVGGTAADTIGGAGSAAASVVAATVDAADRATFGVVGDALELVDDHVLDPLDAATRGVVDIDLDDGDLSVQLGVDGVLQVGASVGDDGVSAASEVASTEVAASVREDGVAAAATLGVDLGPLPYLDAELEVEADGDVHARGHAHGVLPTPVGLLSGSADVHLDTRGDDVLVDVDARGTLVTPGGTTIRGEAAVDYLETDEGTHLAFEVAGSVTDPGSGTLAGGLGYSRTEHDGTLVETFHAEASATGYGVSIDAGAAHVSVTTDGTTASAWTTHADADLDLADAVAAAGGVEDSVDGLFDDLT